MKNRYIKIIAAAITLFVIITIIVLAKVIWKNTYGLKKEISYTLTYTLYGEEKTLSGSAICQFDGYGFTTKSGIEPMYSIYLKGEEETKSSGLGITVLDLRGKEVPENFEEYAYKRLFDTESLTGLSFSAGSARSYIKQAPGHRIKYNLDLSVDSEVVYESTGGIGTGGSYITPEAAEELFGIRLIRFEYDIK